MKNELSFGLIIIYFILFYSCSRGSATEDVNSTLSGIQGNRVLEVWGTPHSDINEVTLDLQELFNEN